MDDMPTYRADIDVANDNNRRRKRTIWLAILATLIALLCLGYYQARAYLLEGLPNLPDKATMWEMNLKPNITILDKDGQVIGHRGPYIGKPLKIEELPQYVADAFLAIEDERFYDHTGIDNKAIMRALLTNTKTGEKTQGASTLTQQLVKNMVLTPEKTYRRKVQEMLLARDMEAMLSKPEILELYLNRINLGPQVFGIEAASQKYFGHSATELSLSQAALLAALPKAPSRYDPTRNYDGALTRSHLVLQRMTANALISPQQEIEARADKPNIVPDAEPLLDQDVIGYVFDLVSERAAELVGGQSKDLIVKTTIDTKRQKMAHDSVVKILEASGKSKRVSEASLVSIENGTGAIRTLVGGRDYALSKFNRATQAQRQPGSAFKAFVYAAAIEDGFTPGTVRIDQPTTIGEWEPENYTKRYRGPMTIREALKHSINTIAAQVGTEIGPTQIVNLAERFGVKTELRPEYSISLGTSEVNLLEMTSAYTVFANEGLLQRAHLITDIKNTAQKPLYTRRLAKPQRVYPVPYARQMTSMLRDVVASGTGHGAKMGSREVAGKTGTSQDYRDGWFFGFTAQYTTGVWMGNDDNSSMNKITGGLLPVDLWKSYMLKAHKGYKFRPLKAPQADPDDPETQAQIAFYNGLASAFENERDVASGINTNRNSGASSGQ
jgi:penicillin-binding protein 1A